MAALTGGGLTVNGTDTADDITVDEDSGFVSVTVNDKQVSFSSKSVKSILVNAGAGNDTIVVETTIGGPTTILGGAGNDNILGVGEHEVINGGAGDDTLRCATTASPPSSAALATTPRTFPNSPATSLSPWTTNRMTAPAAAR